MSTYVGPDHTRLNLTTWNELKEAVAQGWIDESHWVELKEDFPGGRSENQKIAKEAASLAVDGGVLIVGIAEDKSKASEVAGITAVNHLEERVDAAIRANTDPPLFVHIPPPIRHPEDPDRWCLIIDVPTSGRAPHQVNGVYYGRDERSVIRLGHDEVLRVINSRGLGQEPVRKRLEQLSALRPFPADHDHGRIYFVAHPAAGRDDALERLLSGDRHDATVRALLAEADNSLSGNLNFQGALWGGALQGQGGQLRWRDSGMAFTNFGSQQDEAKFREILLGYDGSVSILDSQGAGWHTNYPQEMRTISVIGKVHAAVVLTALLADRHAEYQGDWHIGLRLDGLSDTRATETLDQWAPTPYFGDMYERVVTTTTTQIATAPSNVTETLLRRLLRPFGTDNFLASLPGT